jgi:hypothetical protein
VIAKVAKLVLKERVAWVVEIVSAVEASIPVGLRT